MTKKVDFRSIGVENVERKIETIDVSKNLGNQIYMQAQTIDVRDFGRKIFEEGQVEVDGEQELIIRRTIMNWSLVLREGIEKTLNDD